MEPGPDHLDGERPERDHPDRRDRARRAHRQELVVRVEGERAIGRGDPTTDPGVEAVGDALAPARRRSRPPSCRPRVRRAAPRRRGSGARGSGHRDSRAWSSRGPRRRARLGDERHRPDGRDRSVRASRLRSACGLRVGLGEGFVSGPSVAVTAGSADSTGPRASALGAGEGAEVAIDGTPLASLVGIGRSQSRRAPSAPTTITAVRAAAARSAHRARGCVAGVRRASRGWRRVGVQASPLPAISGRRREPTDRPARECHIGAERQFARLRGRSEQPDTQVAREDARRLGAAAEGPARLRAGSGELGVQVCEVGVERRVEALVPVVGGPGHVGPCDRQAASIASWSTAAAQRPKRAVQLHGEGAARAAEGGA